MFILNNTLEGLRVGDRNRDIGSSIIEKSTRDIISKTFIILVNHEWYVLNFGFRYMCILG